MTIIKNTNQDGYFVYRLLNRNGAVIFVGKAKNLNKLFNNSEKISEDISEIEYIVCSSESEMIWKEIYYINLFYNTLSKNKARVYQDGIIKDMNFNDRWIPYRYFESSSEKYSYLQEKYIKYVVNVPDFDYKNLIHIDNHEKLNDIGREKNAISKKMVYGS